LDLLQLDESVKKWRIRVTTLLSYRRTAFAAGLVISVLPIFAVALSPGVAGAVTATSVSTNNSSTCARTPPRRRLLGRQLLWPVGQQHDDSGTDPVAVLGVNGTAPSPGDLGERRIRLHLRHALHRRRRLLGIQQGRRVGQQHDDSGTDPGRGRRRQWRGHPLRVTSVSVGLNPPAPRSPPAASTAGASTLAASWQQHDDSGTDPGRGVGVSDSGTLSG